MLALGLPVTLTGRETLTAIISSVGLFPLLVQVLTMPMLRRRLALSQNQSVAVETA